MASNSSGAVSEVCRRLKSLGYAASKRIRIYGQEFEIVSDPFFLDGIVAIHVRTGQEPGIRVLPLPAMLIHAAAGKEERFIRAA